MNKKNRKKKAAKQRLLAALLCTALLLPSFGPGTITAEASRIYGTSVTEEEEETTSRPEGLIMQPKSDQVDASEETTSGLTLSGGNSGSDASDVSEGRIYGSKLSYTTSTGSSLLVIDYPTVFARTELTHAASAGEMYLFLREAGFSEAAAAGVLGNIERESNFNPLSGSEDDVYGLFQMKGGYLTQMKNYCAQYGLDFYSVDGQMNAMIAELAADLFEAYTGQGCVFYWGDETKVYGSDEHMYEQNYCWLSAAMTLEDYKKITEPRLAAEIWRRVVERNRGSAEDITKRGNYAQAYYNAYRFYDGTGYDIVEEASKYIGRPYVFGGNSLTTGIDCSHFICKILTITGHYNGSYINSKGFLTAGQVVKDVSQVQPGDVLCYNGHVAFYAGEGTIIHAASAERGIVMDRGVDIQNICGGLLAIRRFR